MEVSYVRQALIRAGLGTIPIIKASLPRVVPGILGGLMPSVHNGTLTTE
jgi:hypothetical protein